MNPKDYPFRRNLAAFTLEELSTHLLCSIKIVIHREQTSSACAKASVFGGNSDLLLCP